MNKFKTGKKFLALALALMVAFSGISAYAINLEELLSDYDPEVCHEHIYGDWHIDVQPTCKTDGKKHRQCENCGQGVETVVMPADPNAHVPGPEKIISNPTCTTPGVSEYVCEQEGCNKTYRVTTAKLGHNLAKDSEGKVIINVTVEPSHMFKHYSNGRGYSNCTRCGLSVDQIVYVPHDFDGATPDIEKPATCKEPGIKKTMCNICQYDIEETIPVDKDAHVFSGKAQLVESEKFDCKTDGVGVVICEKCNVTAKIAIPKEDAHDYIGWEVQVKLPDDAYCGSSTSGRGLEVRFCETCNTELERRIITAPHTFEETNADGEVISHVTGKVASTCCTRGYEVGNCVVCNQKDVKNYYPIDEDAHNYIEKVVTAPTCTQEGQLIRLCKYDASHFEYDTIEKIDHVYDRKWDIKEATCSEPGYKKNHCAKCDQDINIVLPKDENAHDFSGRKWVVKVEARCGKTGYEEASCNYCHNLVSRPLPLCYSDGAGFKTIEPTCYKEGQTGYICKECGSPRTIKIPVDKSAHVPAIGYKVIKEATCTETGVESLYCAYCNDNITDNQRVIPQKTHVVEEIVVEYPQCAADVNNFKSGTKYHKCVNCTYDTQAEGLITIPAQHSYSGWSVAEKDKGKTPNCESPITLERICYGCGYVDSNDKHYGDHVDVNWTFENGQSCVTGGTAVKRCTVCHEVYDKKTVAAGKHTDLEFVSDKIPQTDTICFGNVYKCLTCGEEVVVSRPHSFIIIKKGYEPTCDLPGLTDSKYCSTCKSKYEQVTRAPLGHIYDYDSNGTKYCTRCKLYHVDDAVLETCEHFCHQQGIVAKVLKMLSSFFWKLFKTSHFCKCGAAHYHEEAATLNITGKNLAGKYEGTYSCTECEVDGKEIVLK